MFKKAAEFLVEQLKAKGIRVMRYDSYSSNSVYLKLDDGVLGTIRISDHRGKKHLKYKYNLIKDEKRRKQVDRGVTRYYFPMRDIELLAEKIMYDKSQILTKWGDSAYNNFMKKNRAEAQGKKGFWQKARYV